MCDVYLIPDVFGYKLYMDRQMKTVARHSSIMSADRDVSLQFGVKAQHRVWDGNTSH